MWLKCVGCLLIIVAGSALGFRYANRYEERLQQIKLLTSCLTTLESYIEHVAMPLTQAFIQIVQGLEGPIAELFMKTALAMEHSRQLSPVDALEENFERLKNDIRLEQPEQELLLLLVTKLTVINPKGHSAYFAMTLKQLQDIEEQARQNQAVNVKMFRYLGICGSLILVILLL
ncbi:stage III sporulation protein AB [Sporomusaceae bacterium BoRhaA]|uniref:stage III sporulation protein AB n=1 Tax=Pelorhabdus rhamnosifermentans TaxID=2772457 RepID=UPI001C062383|nr:stage III sporulation protein AB [Pelorhabdus rhamnosifermentans]MBU2700930.1 stage III sporulation protein AB [Pelorhabdus rhamnosifermentans]